MADNGGTQTETHEQGVRHTQLRIRTDISRLNETYTRSHRHYSDPVTYMMETLNYEHR